MAGFPCNIFCDKIKTESYRCLICLDVCRSAVTCESGAHLFCRNCLIQSLRCTSSPRCPVCQNPLTAPVPCAFVTAQVSALDVICIHDKCKWKGTCGRLDGHLEADCFHQPIRCSGEGGCGEMFPRGEMTTHQQFACLQSCPNSKLTAEGKDMCNVRLSRDDLIDHLQHHCKLRLTHCPHPSCKVSTMYSKMQAHLEICPYAPVSCPQQCGVQNLSRENLDAHKRDCPNEPVPCVHSHLGCSHVAPRSQIGQHEQDTAVHFVIVSKTIMALQKSHELQFRQMQQMFDHALQEQNSVFNKKLQENTVLFENLLEEQATVLQN